MELVDELPAAWYAVQTRSNFEKKAAAQLAARDVTHYLPLRAVVHKWKDRRKNLDLPLFSGYVFARFVDSPQNRLRVLQAPGVVRIVGRRPDGIIEAIPSVEITGIRRLLASSLSWEPHEFLERGDRVRVLTGPLMGLEGTFLRRKSKTRLLLSIPLLSQSVATDIDADNVELIKTAQPLHLSHTKRRSTFVIPTSHPSQLNPTL